MINLKNVSKFYYSKGVIASGFHKINLEFKMGEFVAITGESGSGKSTLLNVISGLDTYEEGEMYIDGKETSHYTEKDFEDYRRKYIGNIFQNFNLVNSYTVYQNIELVLLLNGNKKKDIKDKVLELIKKVGLYKFRNTKISRLSGGQKQRVAIARALAKDTPIIIADEPTGNLDSKSATEIIKLLSEISKNKLVIIVTHNYEQVEKYVTRKVKMHDGKILEDKRIKHFDEIENINFSQYHNITNFNKIRLAIRNTFNILPKFLLLFLVYLFITVAVISEYASKEKDDYLSSIQGYSDIFVNTSDKRLLVKRSDNKEFNNEDYNRISSIKNVDYIVKNDLLLDSSVAITDNENYWISGSAAEIKNFKGKLDVGKMPIADDEVILEGNPNDYYIDVMGEELLNKELYLQDLNTEDVISDKKIKITGIKYSDDISEYNYNIYFSDSVINTYLYQINQMYSTIKVLFMEKYYETTEIGFRVRPSTSVTDGNAYISSDLSSLCPYENCKNKTVQIEANNLYYQENLNLNINNVYTKWNIKKLLELEYENNNGYIYISVNDYNKLFNKGNYQSSVFIKDVKLVDDTIKELEKNNFKVLLIKDTLDTDGNEILSIIQNVMMGILLIALFFISYFVINIILKSRNVYFSIIRMLGATKKIAKELLVIELLIVSNIAYFSFMIIIYLNHIGKISVKFIDTILNYLTFKDYFILYIILMLMSYLISQKFSKKLFKKSAISTMKEEV